jgi:hypothetical protein
MQRPAIVASPSGPRPTPDLDVAPLLASLEPLGADTDLRPALALLAARDYEPDSARVAGAIRRAMLLLAAGGDPHRELELDGRAVTSLAAELDAPELRAALGRGLGALALAAAAYPSVAAAVAELEAGAELAVRAWACALLAEEL